MTKARTHHPDLKKLTNSFKIIDRLILNKSYRVSSKDFGNDQFISLRKDDRGFSFLFEHSEILFQYEKFDFEDVLFEMGKFQFRVNTLYATQRTFGQMSGIVGSLNSLNFNNSMRSFHRLIIPISHKPNFVFSIENISLQYQYKQVISSRLAIEIDLPVGKFHLYQVSKKLNDKKKPSYIVLDSQSLMYFEEFSETCHSILISFGFISGSFIQNQGFFFQYKDHHLNLPISFYHTPFRKSIKASFVPIYSNPHGVIHDRKTANLYKDKIKVMSSESFSRLCHLTNSESDLKSALFLILETTNTSLVSSPGLLSIALETLANIVSQENKKELAPIPDKKTAKKLRQSLKKIVGDFSEEIGEKAKSIINNRIDHINQRTNRDKLLVPFDILGIELTKMDVEAIEQRNSFLHGRIPMIQDKNPETIPEGDQLRYFLYLKLLTLISAIILRLSGFRGHIVNYPKIHESSTGVKLKESHYRKV